MENDTYEKYDRIPFNDIHKFRRHVLDIHLLAAASKFGVKMFI